MKTKGIKVVIVDRNELFREGLSRILNDQPNIEVVYSTGDGMEGLVEARKLKPDILIGDTEVSETAFEKMLSRVNELPPETHIISLSDQKDHDSLFRFLRLGTRAYVTKQISVKDLVRTITRVHAGEVLLSPPMAVKLLEGFASMDNEHEKRQKTDNSNLSRREQEVLRLVSKGITNKGIAEDLFISENTVKVHISSILAKLQVHNRQQAASKARERGFLSEADQPSARRK